MSNLRRLPATALSVVLALLTAACVVPAATPLPPPTELEARDHLAKVVQMVLGNAIENVCELGSGTCPVELRNADLAAIPAGAPVVLGTETIQPSLRQDGAWDLGGLLLKLCGRDGRDEPYYSEMLVFREAGNRLVAINALYWLGSRVARSPAVPAATFDLPACPV